jgi:hypothetical protein
MSIERLDRILESKSIEEARRQRMLREVSPRMHTQPSDPFYDWPLRVFARSCKWAKDYDRRKKQR